MRIAIIVPGRWHAFDLARELSNQGHTVRLLTNYPRWAVERFGVRRDCVRGFWQHGVLARAVERIGGAKALRRFEAPLHVLFGRWAAATLRGGSWDFAYLFSGVAEESLRSLESTSTLRMLVRESSHIRTQDRLLRQEEVRTGTSLDRPSPWMIAREEREYALADVIRVPSSFVHHTFMTEGIRSAKVRLIAPGIRIDAFRSSPAQLERRLRRVLSGERLRILSVGTFAFRKGAWDTTAVIRELGTARFDYRFVGPAAAETKHLVAELQFKATFVSKQPELELPAIYAWGDVFMLPTIEDGYAIVLAQAAAAGLPLLTTTNSAGPDLIGDGQNGWVLPIRSPAAFIERLQWAERHRVELAEMIRQTQSRLAVHDASAMAEELADVCRQYLRETLVPA
jgi:glycosyltransferase involved in cell wall biosynthesis